MSKTRKTLCIRDASQEDLEDDNEDDSSDAAKLQKKKKIAKYFAKFDKNSDGLITKDEMKEVFNDWKDKDIDDIFTVADKDGNGVVDIDEFIEWALGAGRKLYKKKGITASPSPAGYMPTGFPGFGGFFGGFATDAANAVPPPSPKKSAVESPTAPRKSKVAPSTPKKSTAEPPAATRKSNVAPSSPKKSTVGPSNYTVCRMQADMVESKKQTRLQGRLNLSVKEASDLAGAWIPGRSNDPYCLVSFGNFQVLRTQYVQDTLKPNWEKTGTGVATVDIVGDAESVVLEIWNHNARPFPDVQMGSASLPTTRVLESCKKAEGVYVEEWLQIEPQGKIRVSYRYEAASLSPDTFDVPNVYFKEKSCTRVTPYICATCPPGLIPHVETASGRIVARSFWDDLHFELLQAQKFIYIAGWSVWTKLKLCRTDGRSEEDLGDLLKRRAEEGVCVCVLIWKEWGSMLGTLCTRDRETFEFFRDSKVHCACVRRASNNAERTDAEATENMKHVVYTHHQKTVCLDKGKELVAYVGGIDLCGGRWDRPDHPLFSTLGREHAEDYYQNMISGTTVQTGPRQPWQDIAARLEGSVARDVISNFEARWKLQAKDQVKHLVSFAEECGVGDDEDDDDDDGELSFTQCKAVKNTRAGDDAVGAWRAQVFRSIDGDSAILRRQGSSTDSRLTKYKGVWYDKSCHTAYVHHIRRAQRFLYIENQYFMGSSHLWNVPVEGCENLVPVEIANKVASKIAAGEPFHAYINIPMWPEGSPDSEVIQEILHWQHSTIEMMYGIVTRALEEIGDKATSPLEYLSFYCLGNRERDLAIEAGSEETGENDEDEVPHYGSGLLKKTLNQALNRAAEPSGDSAKSMWAARRAPIYIHSKCMIVDDTYMMVGSANINERSLNGMRDSEIIFGAYQPSFVEGIDRGSVQAFRMQLWAAHLGIKDAVKLNRFRNPHEVQVVREIRKRAQSHWKQYTQEQNIDMTGHLLPYPYTVKRDGGSVTVTGVDSGCELEGATSEQHCFPDTRASITGQVSSLGNAGSSIVTM